MSDGPDNKRTPAAEPAPAEWLALRDEIAGERDRIKGVLLWSVTAFIFMALLLAGVLLGAGIVVLRQTQAMHSRLETLDESVALNTVQAGSIADRVTDVERTQLSLASRLNAVQTTQEQSLERLDAGFRRHARWIETRETADEREKRNLNERLLALSEQASGTAMALEQMQRKLESFLSIEGAVVVPSGEPPPVDEAPADEEGAIPDRLDVFAAANIEAMFEALLEDVAVPMRDRDVPSTISVVSFPNGDRYEGEFRNGLMHGWGIYVTRLGDRYEGTFKNDLKEGAGTLVSSSGERYTGHFSNGIREGTGSLTRADGTRYAGEFRNDMINGRGVMLYAGGNRYAGDFMNARRHGHGVMRFFNGDVYEGEFREDARTGKGTYLFADGSRYVGDFVEGVRHGNGHFYFADGAEYIGPFRNGNMHGEGVRIYPDGQRVKSLWKDGEHVRDLRD